MFSESFSKTDVCIKLGKHQTTAYPEYLPINYCYGYINSYCRNVEII